MGVLVKKTTSVMIRKDSMQIVPKAKIATIDPALLETRIGQGIIIYADDFDYFYARHVLHSLQSRAEDLVSVMVKDGESIPSIDEAKSVLEATIEFAQIKPGSRIKVQSPQAITGHLVSSWVWSFSLKKFVTLPNNCYLELRDIVSLSGKKAIVANSSISAADKVLAGQIIDSITKSTAKAVVYIFFIQKYFVVA